MSLVKKYLISHPKNNYHPHLLRNGGIFTLFSLVALLFLVSSFGKIAILNSDLTALVLPRVLVDYTNDNRVSNKYGRLAVSPVLEKAAQMKANDMAEKGYFAHKSPEGLTPWHWFQQAGYDWSYAGENLAVNFSESLDVSNAWMNSPSHKENILNGNFTEIGIATAEGMYQGKKTVFVVQLFGRPAKKQTTPTNIQNIKTPTVKSATTTIISSGSRVLSESVSSEEIQNNNQNDLFISAEKESVDYTTSDKKYSSFLDRVVFSQGNYLSLVYLVIFIITVLSIISIFISGIRKHHTKPIVWSVLLFITMCGLIYIYKFIIFTPVSII